MPPVLRNYKLDSLTKLRLCSVEVTRKALEYILFACPLLESLYIYINVTCDELQNFQPITQVKAL